MSIDANLPVILAQMGHVQKIVGNLVAHPGIQHEASKLAAVAALKRAQSQVDKTDASRELKLTVNKDGQQGGGHHAAGARKEKPQVDEEQELEQSADTKDPWQGNIVDMKV